MTCLYFNQYRTPRVGDYVVAYRNETPVGNIHWSMTDGCYWRMAMGTTITGDFSPDFEEAKARLIDAFKEWCHATGLSIEGPSATPKGLERPLVQRMIDEMDHFKFADHVEEYMKSPAVQRASEDLTEEEREVLRDAAKRRYRTLPRKEKAA